MRRERLLLALTLAAFVVSVSTAIAQRVPFGDDEAVYATQARAWAAGGPVTGIRLQRGPFLPSIGTLIYKAGGRSEWPFRMTGLMFGVAAVIGVWGLGRAVTGPRAALIAAALFASGSSILERSSQFMTDVPATAFLLALALVLWLNRERPGRSLLLVAPIAAGAFYMRYASILPIVLMVLTVAVIWRGSLLHDRRLVVATIVLFAALLVPHAVRAIHATGRPWGLVTYTARFAGRSYLGEGLVRYLAWFPFSLAGPVAGISMIAGIVAAVVRRSKEAAFLVIPAVCDIVLLGLTEHADKRFIFFPVALLCIAGAPIVAKAGARIAVPILVVALAAGAAFTIYNNGKTRTDRLPPALAGPVIAARARSEPNTPCTVQTVEIAETTWYSGCSSYAFGEQPTAFAVLYSVAGVRLAEQPAVPPAGAVEIGAPQHDGRVVARVYSLPAP